MAAARRELREYLLGLSLLAAGGGLVWLAARQGWAQVDLPATGAVPATVLVVRGQDLVPVAGVLWLVCLAGLVAVIATRRLARRLVGALLVLAGAVTAVLVSMPVSAAAVRAAAAAAHATSQLQAGSVTGSGSGAAAPLLPQGLSLAGGPPQVVMAAFPWHWLALLGAVAVLVTGIGVSWRGGRWPVMSARYDAPGGPGGRGSQPAAVADPAALWESLSQGIDPTDRPAGPAVG